MPIRHLRAALPGLAIALVSFSQATAHEIVGNRFFPATLGIDDPGVNDELSIPTVAAFKTGDDPSFKQRDISGEFSKRITEGIRSLLRGDPTAISARPVGRRDLARTDFRTWRRRSNIACSKTRYMSS